MSCPDWTALAARRDEDPEAWTAGLAHADDCTACRAASLDVDPLLLFRRLATPPLDRAEVDSLRRGVETVRRSRRLERARGVSRRRHLPWAAAAVLAAGLLLTGGPSPDDERSEPPGAGTRASDATSSAIAFAALSELPVIETLETSAPLLQVDRRDLTVVMVERAAAPRPDA